MVPLNVGVRETLQAIKPEHATGPIFRGKRGPYTDRGIRNLLAELGRRAGVNQVHPHRFRHDIARRLIEQVGLPTWRPYSVTAGWIRSGSTVSPTTNRCSERPTCWTSAKTSLLFHYSWAPHSVTIP
jgi:hypothetical protein